MSVFSNGLIPRGITYVPIPVLLLLYWVSSVFESVQQYHTFDERREAS